MVLIGLQAVNACETIITLLEDLCVVSSGDQYYSSLRTSIVAFCSTAFRSGVDIPITAKIISVYRLYYTYMGLLTIDRNACACIGHCPQLYLIKRDLR